MNKKMRRINIILMGFGHVGRAFLQVVREKSEMCRLHYGLDFRVCSVFRSSGALYSPLSLDLDEVLEYSASSPDKLDWKPDLELPTALEALGPGVLVECIASSSTSGQPGLDHICGALDRGWHVVTADKSPLVVDFRGLRRKAEKSHVSFKSSGATAAALPTLDVALYSLAGTEISRIEGILNGTTNFILTRMKQAKSYPEALEEARSQGIAEPDPSLDVSGQDTASKLLIISNAVLHTDFSLQDVEIEGIEDISPELLDQGMREDRALKLLGRVYKKGKTFKPEVVVSVIDRSHPLFGVDGAEKGIIFITDTMGSIAVIGGKSDPRGAAAALLKDIINIYRT